LKDAIDGFGTKENSLIDIVCTKTNAEMRELKSAYKQMFRKDPEHDCTGDVSGDMRRLIVSLMMANRSDYGPDPQKAAIQARELYQSGVGKLGTDEATFNRIFASESFPHLKAVFEEYQRMSGNDIVRAIKSEMTGATEKAFVCLAETALNPPAYWARRLYEAMEGVGTSENTLVRICALRSEIDMVQIKQVFQATYGKPLEAAIRAEVNSDFERGLLCLIGAANWS